MSRIEVNGFQLEHFKETPGWCGPASLTIAVKGVRPELEVSEIKMANLLGLQALAVSGSGHKDMLRVAQSFLPNSRAVRWSLSELLRFKEGLAVINFMNGPVSVDSGHYAIVSHEENLKKTHLVLVDPELTRRIYKRPTRKWLENNFFDISHDGEVIHNWALLVLGRISYLGT